MKKYYYLLPLICSVALILSCSKSDDNEVIDEAWKSANEEAFNKLTFDPGYSRIMSFSNTGHIYYKVIKEGAGSKPIYYTSRVKVYYIGSLINGTIFDRAEYPNHLPAEFAVNQVIEGWTTVLQYMREGDRWEVWIPQELGYGSTAQERSGVVSIPAYSTLKFEIEVVKASGIEEL